LKAVGAILLLAELVQHGVDAGGRDLEDHAGVIVGRIAAKLGRAIEISVVAQSQGGERGGAIGAVWLRAEVVNSAEVALGRYLEDIAAAIDASKTCGPVVIAIARQNQRREGVGAIRAGEKMQGGQRLCRGDDGRQGENDRHEEEREEPLRGRAETSARSSHAKLTKHDVLLGRPYFPYAV
jgi:hypothetical protein